MFAIVSVLAGVLVAGLFIPLAGLLGVGSKAAADELNNLPAELATPLPATRSQGADGATARRWRTSTTRTESRSR